MNKYSFTLFLIITFCTVVYGNMQSMDKMTAVMDKFPGFFTFYWDKKDGKIWLEIERMDSEFLYVNSLPAGLGSNDIGLDRNRIGRTHLVKFQRFGPKVLLIQSNYSFRATSNNPYEQKAVKDSFAKSVLWGFRVKTEAKNKVLVDATPFLLTDTLDVVNTIKRAKQGNYKLDIKRSAIFMPNTKNFPLNTEIETILTFTASNPGPYVKEVTPNPKAVTIRQRHSFIKLPDKQFKPRIYDPRSSYFGIEYMDFATPVGESIVKRYICRHRLEKKDPDAKISDPVKPLIYYVDRGAPEPVRTALIEGASWWNEAFESIGYRNAFIVKLLPVDADPMDIRYNVINWVHRSTRGWSYGSTVIDPRTGEILKGHVTLGSLRIRQDFLIARGLIGNYEKERNNSSQLLEMALARIRQLSCHEVGHTIGLSHNYSSSANNRASVMDYPHPLVKIKEDGSLDLSDAYDSGVGEWDKVSIAYGYQDFPRGTDEINELKLILNKAFSRGLYFHTDQDARPAGSVHPLAHLWDNGMHPVEELKRIMRIRSIALNRFSVKRIPFGEPMTTLEEVFVPVYMFHRYQIEACSKVLGGLYYNHSIRGDKQVTLRFVPAIEQRSALGTLLSTIQPENLAINEKTLKIIHPRAPGYRETRELFSGYTGTTFDPLGAAETVANLTVKLLLNPERAARLVEYHSRNKEFPGLNEVLEKLIKSTWKSRARSGLQGEIQRTVNFVVLQNLMKLAINKKTSTQVHAITYMKLEELKGWLTNQMRTANKKDRKAHFFHAIFMIKMFQKDPQKVNIRMPLKPPQGSPIGTEN